MWQKYGKSLAMLLAAIVMAGITTYRQVADQGVSPSEWVTVIIGAFTVITVWAAVNVPAWSKAKTFVAAVMLVLNLLVGFLTDSHLSSDEMLLLVVNFLGALGVVAAPAVSTLAVSPVGNAPARFAGK